MGVFTPEELAYLQQTRALARIATVAVDGTPHVTPVGWALTADRQAIEIGGHNLGATKKFRDIQRCGVAALVIDEVLVPWQPRGIEIRGPAEAILEPAPRIRVRPARVVSWGFEGATGGRDTGVHRPVRGSLGRDDHSTEVRPYAVVRRNRFSRSADIADDGPVVAAEGDLEEFGRIHAAQPGYHGNLALDAGDGSQLILTIWASAQHAAEARVALGPAVQRLLSPGMAEPSELLAAGEVTSTDIPSLVGMTEHRPIAPQVEA